MQIEEAFRDVKTVRFGMGFELNLSRTAERLQILLMVAMIATFVLWLLGMAARRSEQHLHYQANSVKKRHVLSVIYLGLRVAGDNRFRFDLKELPYIAEIMYDSIQSHGEGW